MVEMSYAYLINVFGISAGFGACSLILMQLNHAPYLQKDAKRNLRLFFSLVIVYIMMHMTRQMLEGNTLPGVTFAIHAVTFLEFLVSGFLAYMMTLLALYIARPERSAKILQIAYFVLLVLHSLGLFAAQFTGFYYYFDELNVYHRSQFYILSNISPVLMMLLDIYLLIRYRSKFKRSILIAFWLYLVLPVVGIVLQLFFPKVQFLIFGTVAAGIYMFGAILHEQTKTHNEQQKEADRIETELSMATRIQADMLPNIFPAFPERDDFDVFASMNPAKEVGGDFYDFFLVDDDHLGLVMADVSGKGVPAALFMMISKILVQNYAMTGKDAAKALEAVNNQICLNNREEMFVTVWLGILDLRDGTLVAANAGHEYPVLRQPDGDFELIKDKHGFVIGGMSGVRYRPYTLQLRPGAKLFLYTDGVAEATNAKEELFGTDRMIEALRAAQDLRPQDVLASVNRAVDAFVQDAPQFDDLTMLCVQYNGTK